jgi:hypothetical protein
VPVPAPGLPQLPAGSGGPGGPSGPGGAAGSGSGIGGAGGGGVPGGMSALLTARHALVQLRLARRAASRPIWRAYLPEVPPA